MSDKIKIDSQSVISLANEMQSINLAIDREYRETMKCFLNMFISWGGKASDSSREVYQTIEKAFSQSRYAVMNNYVRFLKSSVAEGYENVEKVNTGLAENFKT